MRKVLRHRGVHEITKSRNHEISRVRGNYEVHKKYVHEKRGEGEDYRGADRRRLSRRAVAAACLFY